MKTIFIVSLLSMLIIIFYLCKYFEWYSNSSISTIPTVSFPFKNMFDDKGNKLNIILIAAPFRSKKDDESYESYKKQGLSFAGISSYLDFPNPINNPYEDTYHVLQKHNYPSMVTTWLNCFRKNGYTQPFSHLPHILLTEADLKDVSTVKIDTTIPKEYDFLYCCLPDNDQCTPGWQSYNRNWDLAKKCLEVMCSQFNLKGILVGRKGCEFTNQCDGIVKVVPFLPYNDFQKEIQKCRFLFVPNISDASPRVITETICYNIPVLVNQNILGGWHNVIPSVTGEFFTDENDIASSISKLMKNYSQYQPRKWYTENRGHTISGKKLANFLIQHYPTLNNKDMKYATITL